MLAIPAKRTERNLVTYLTDPEVDALLAACDQRTWTGRRDHAMLALTVQTGLRVSELAGLTRQDITLGAGANVHTVGKGRKERRTPLLPATGGAARPGSASDAALPATRCFPPAPAPASAATPSNGASPATWPWPARACPSLRPRRVSMHALRHTAAMRLLLAGNDITVIALWLGHEQIATTNIYLHADMSHKQRAIDRPGRSTAGRAATGPPMPSSPSWRPFDYADIIRWLTPLSRTFSQRSA